MDTSSFALQLNYHVPYIFGMELLSIGYSDTDVIHRLEVDEDGSVRRHIVRTA